MKQRATSLLLLLLLIGGASCTSPTESATDPTTDPAVAAKRIGNMRTMVFHTTGCRYVSEIVEKISFASREEAIAAGYRADESNSGCRP